AAEHERLTSQMQARGDPTPALRALEALIASHPGYPRGAAALILVARGWARDGDRERAIAAARRAVAIAGPGDRLPAAAELARQLIRAGELDQARTEIAEIDHPAVAADLRAELARAELRDRVRLAAWAMLAAIALVAVIALRRDAGTWRAAARRIARPPIEVVFLAPIALLLAIVASSGNPLVGRAVRAIALAGLAIAWLSGALLEAARARRGALGARRVLVHVALAMLAAGAAAYLAISRDQLFDLVAETLRTGPVR
ncbi:MAG TPA: hypothetical protein VLX92_30940, partial [Kofleriaceae bacterium]|nr:hypothetical protein [Kofleriaceae bacterium]